MNDPNWRVLLSAALIGVGCLMVLLALGERAC